MVSNSNTVTPRSEERFVGVGRLASYSVSFIKYNLTRSGQGESVFLYLYLGIVAELGPGGPGDILGAILGVPPEI